MRKSIGWFDWFPYEGILAFNELMTVSLIHGLDFYGCNKFCWYEYVISIIPFFTKHHVAKFSSA